jgi:hypothetical protein
MPANTPNLALPYPLPTDQVAAGAGDIRALAEAIDPLLANAVEAPGGADRYRLQAGQVVIGTMDANTETRVTVVYPEPFAAVPVVLAFPSFPGPAVNTNQGRAPAVAWLMQGWTAAQADFGVRQTSSGPADVTLQWLAFGLR